MAIDIGDAVLTFLGDTTRLDETFTRVGTEVPAKMAPATAAFKSTSDAVQDVSDRMAVGQQGAVKLGEVMNLAGETSRESMYQARGEMQLVDEMIGVHLPRHVVSFIAELPGVGAALSAAFSATAVLFIIEAVAKVIEKFVEMRGEAHKLELAGENFGTAVANSFNSLDDKLLRAQIHADELAGDHLGALKKELELIDHQSLGELEHQFQALSKAADAFFKQLETSWYTFNLGSKGAEAALESFKAKYDLLLATGDNKQATDLLAGTKKSAEDVLSLMLQFNNLKDLPTDTWSQRNEKNAEEVRILNDLKQRQVDLNELKVRSFGIDEKTITAQQTIVATLNAQENAQKEIEKTKDVEKGNKQTEENNRIEAEQEQALKAQLAADKQAAAEEDKLEDDRRNHFIANMQEEEKEKIAATRQGSEERIKIIDAAIKEEEAHGFQDTAYYKSLQVERVRAVQARIDQEQKAQQKADSEELKNAEQQAKREAEAVKESSTEQEKAIQEVGKAKLLSQGETSKRLIAAYEDEKQKTIAVLNGLLTEERALMDKMSKELANAKLNPAITPEQVAQAEQLLNQLKNAVANTETQIAKTKSDFNAKELAADHGYYGQALALAIAFGHQKLAENLKENHALLLSAQAELADAKAKTTNTHATNDQIKALEHLIATLKKEETQLEHNATKGLSAWKQFSAGFRDEAQQNIKTMAEMGAQMEQDVAKMGSVIADAFSAMLSGQESFGAAMLHSTEKMISQMAQQWAEYFLAKGIADVFFDPPLGAAEIAAGVALEAIAGALGGLASGGGKSSATGGAASGTAAPAKGSPATVAQQPVTTTVNVPHFGTGALVSRPTLAVVGDSREAIMPLDDHRAMSAIAAAIAGASPRGGVGGGEIHIVLHSDIPAVARALTNGVNSGRMRLTSSKSIRNERRS